jgi:hypothetical protein
LCFCRAARRSRSPGLWPRLTGAAAVTEAGSSRVMQSTISIAQRRHSADRDEQASSRRMRMRRVEPSRRAKEKARMIDDHAGLMEREGIEPGRDQSVEGCVTS